MHEERAMPIVNCRGTARRCFAAQRNRATPDYLQSDRANPRWFVEKPRDALSSGRKTTGSRVHEIVHRTVLLHTKYPAY